MTQVQIMWLVIGIVVLLLLIWLISAAVNKKKKEQAERDRVEAARLREEAQARELDLKEKENAARRAQLEADEAEVAAARRREEAAALSSDAESTRADVDDLQSKADTLDPDTDTPSSRREIREARAAAEQARSDESRPGAGAGVGAGVAAGAGAAGVAGAAGYAAASRDTEETSNVEPAAETTAFETTQYDDAASVREDTSVRESAVERDATYADPAESPVDAYRSSDEVIADQSLEQETRGKHAAPSADASSSREEEIIAENAEQNPSDQDPFADFDSQRNDYDSSEFSDEPRTSGDVTVVDEPAAPSNESLDAEEDDWSRKVESNSYAADAFREDDEATELNVSDQNEVRPVAAEEARTEASSENGTASSSLENEEDDWSRKVESNSYAADAFREDDEIATANEATNATATTSSLETNQGDNRADYAESETAEEGDRVIGRYTFDDEDGNGIDDAWEDSASGNPDDSRTLGEKLVAEAQEERTTLEEHGIDPDAPDAREQLRREEGTSN